MIIHAPEAKHSPSQPHQSEAMSRCEHLALARISRHTQVRHLTATLLKIGAPLIVFTITRTCS